MELPLTIQMQIDLTAQAHQRAIAEGFAKLRERLLPAGNYFQHLTPGFHFSGSGPIVFRDCRGDSRSFGSCF